MCVASQLARSKQPPDFDTCQASAPVSLQLCNYPVQPVPHTSVAERKKFVDCKMHVPVLLKDKFVCQVSVWRQLPLCSSRQYR